MTTETKSSVRERAQQTRRGVPSRGEISHVPLSLIDPAPFNARREFPEAEIEKLAESILNVGLLKPIIVRENGRRFELVAGERRLRACKLAGFEAVTASVQKLDDRQAAEIQFVENFESKNLDPIETASGLRELERLGHTAKSLSDLLRLGQDDLRSKLALLSLPETWQERIRKGELSGAAGEILAPFGDVPAVLEAMEQIYQSSWPLPLIEWRGRFVTAVMLATRAMDPADPTGPRFTPTDEQLEALDVRELVTRPGQSVERCCNVSLWDDLQDSAAPFNSDPFAGQSDSTEEADSADDEPLRRLSRNAGTAVAPRRNVPELPAVPLRDRVSDFRFEWLLGVCIDRLNGMTADELQGLATDSLAIDLADEFTLSAEFVDLHSPAEQRELAEELGVDVAGIDDARDLRERLLSASATAVPRSLLTLTTADVAG